MATLSVVVEDVDVLIDAVLDLLPVSKVLFQVAIACANLRVDGGVHVGHSLLGKHYGSGSHAPTAEWVGRNEAWLGNEAGWIAYSGREPRVGVLIDEEARRHGRVQMLATAVVEGPTTRADRSEAGVSSGSFCQRAISPTSRGKRTLD